MVPDLIIYFYEENDCTCCCNFCTVIFGNLGCKKCCYYSCDDLMQSVSSVFLKWKALAFFLLQLKSLLTGTMEGGGREVESIPPEPRPWWWCDC